MLRSPWFIFALALTVRLLFLMEYRESPFYQVPMWDAADYRDIAVALSHGKLDPSFPYRPPLYPLLLAAIYVFVGAGALAPLLIQLLVGSYTCVVVFRLTRRLFGEWPALLAGALASLSGLMFYFESELMPTALVVLLVLLFTEQLVKVGEGEGSASKCGCFLGLGILAWPLLLPLYPLAGLSLWSLKVGVRRLGSYLVGGGIPLALSFLVHLALGYGPVVVSAQGGVNFYIGNNSRSDGITAAFPGLGVGWGWDQVRGWAETRAGRSLTEAQADRLYYKEGISEITHNFQAWLKLTWRKARLFWNRLEISNNSDIYYLASRFPIFGRLLPIGFPAALIPALLGIFLCWRIRSVRLLVMVIVVFYLSVLPFFITSRYRHPLTPLLFALAAGGIFGLFRILKQWRSVSTGKWMGMGLVMAMGFWLPWSAESGINARRWDYGLFTEGNAWEELGDATQAELFYQKALEVNPAAPFVNSRLAVLAEKRGDWDTAIRFHRRELENQPSYAKGWNNLGVVLLNLGEDARAQECFENALSLQPHLEEASQNLALVWNKRGTSLMIGGRIESALTCFQRALGYRPDDPGLMIQVLEARLNAGDTTGVKIGLESLLRRHPDFVPARRLAMDLAGH